MGHLKRNGESIILLNNKFDWEKIVKRYRIKYKTLTFSSRHIKMKSCTYLLNRKTK